MTRYSKLPLVATALLTSAGLVAAVRAGAQAPLDHHQPSSASSDQKTPFTSELDGYVQELLDEWKVAGLAIGIVDSKESYTKVSKAVGRAQSCRRNNSDKTKPQSRPMDILSSQACQLLRTRCGMWARQRKLRSQPLWPSSSTIRPMQLFPRAGRRLSRLLSVMNLLSATSGLLHISPLRMP